jgi:hypothetical protein
MKRPANPGEGEIPSGLSEVPGGGPQAYTDPETGERVIEVEAEVIDEPEPVKAPKARKRK